MKNILLLLVSIFVTYNSYSKVWINEVMSSNQTSIVDDDGSHSDWIELYNDSNTEVDLTGFYLSDDDKKLNKWMFSHVVIPAKSFLIVWASSKDKIEEDGTPHTNFSISADGEPIILTDAGGEMVDSVEVPALEKDVSYARFPDANSIWNITSLPTPKSSNKFIENISVPVASHESGIYANQFQLSLTHSDPAVKIYYTLDGSEPSINNISPQTYSYKNSYRETFLNRKGSFLEGKFQTLFYQNTIEIDPSKMSNRVSNISTTYAFDPRYFPRKEVNKCIVVKAIAVKNGEKSEVITHSYFIDENLGASWNVPVISISANDTNFFDFYKGLMVAGVDFEDWREANPLLAANASRPANFNRSGEENEYPIYFELFDPVTKKKSISQQLGFRIHGASTRIHPQKSLRLYARNEYGKSNLKYDFFDQESGESYKRIVLRSQNSLRVGDILFPNMVNHLKLDVQYNKPSVVYLNGEYYGLFDMKERQDQHYIERKYGVNRDSVDLLSDKYEVNEGSNEHFLEMMDFIKNNSLVNPQNYSKVNEMMDIENYIDYLTVQIYSGNTDWPKKNLDYWRKSTNYQPNAPYGHDGRWRWMLFDTDYAFGLVDKSTCNIDMLEVAIGDGSHWSTSLVNNLLLNQDFKNQFINRAADLLNTTFQSERLLEIVDENMEQLIPLIPEHLDRWQSGLGNVPELVNRVKTFIGCRNSEMFSNYQSRFNAGPFFQLTVDVDDPSKGNYVKVNTIDILSSTVGIPSNVYPWSGQYFTKVPITLTAIPDDGYIFSHWEGLPEGTPQTYTGTFSQNTQITAHFQKLETFDLIYTSSEGGFLIGDTIQNVVINQNGTKVEAVAQNGYTFLGWSDGINTTDRIDTAVQNNIQVQALFELVTSLDEKSIFKTLVYPNPSREVVFIEKNTPLALQYQLLDLNGRVVVQGEINHPIHTINILHLPMSMYILKLIDPSGEEASFKILKH